jgi:hypothetical protein
LASVGIVDVSLAGLIVGKVYGVSAALLFNTIAAKEAEQLDGDTLERTAKFRVSM